MHVQHRQEEVGETFFIEEIDGVLMASPIDTPRHKPPKPACKPPRPEEGRAVGDSTNPGPQGLPHGMVPMFHCTAASLVNIYGVCMCVCVNC